MVVWHPIYGRPASGSCASPKVTSGGSALSNSWSRANPRSRLACVERAINGCSRRIALVGYPERVNPTSVSVTRSVNRYERVVSVAHFRRCGPLGAVARISDES